jgi:hypothetical protein
MWNRRVQFEKEKSLEKPTNPCRDWAPKTFFKRPTTSHNPDRQAPEKAYPKTHISPQPKAPNHSIVYTLEELAKRRTKR